MPDRRTFLSRLGIAGVALASPAAAGAQPVPDASPPVSSPGSPQPEASASSRPGAKAARAVATAVAATMRRFDPKLDDAELAAIATAIDDNLGAGAALNPRKRRLKNSDEPVTRFSADSR